MHEGRKLRAQLAARGFESPCTGPCLSGSFFMASLGEETWGLRVFFLFLLVSYACAASLADEVLVFSCIKEITCMLSASVSGLAQ